MKIPQMGVCLKVEGSALEEKKKASTRTYNRETWLGRRVHEICLEEGQPR